MAHLIASGAKEKEPSKKSFTLKPTMQTYSEFRPTGFDCKGAFLPDRQNWFVVPVSQTRDSGPLAESNFACALEMLGGESDNVEVHRFGHWGPGWFEIIIINPKHAPSVKTANEIESSLADYPVLDEMDYSKRETDEANEIWRDCYCVDERLAYIRAHRRQFEFRGFADLLACVRGQYFCGYASELLN